MGLRQQLRGSLLGAYLGARTAAWRRRVHRGRSAGPPVFELYLQLDDPYSHLLAQVVRRLTAELRCRLEVVVVPAPAAPFDPEPELRLRYAIADAREIAQSTMVDFPATAREPSAPATARASAILLRERPGREQLEIAVQVGEALWSGDETTLAALERRHGTTTEVERGLARNARRLRRRGHYQGGSLRHAGEWFVGVDRLVHLEQALRREGIDLRLSPEPRPGWSPPPVVLVDGSERQLDLFLSFRSPYSYLAIERSAGLARRYGMELVLKPLLPMVVRGYAVPLAKRLHIVLDAAREARRLGIPFGRLCDPLGVGVERCLATFALAEREGRGLAFVSSAMRGIWSEALDMARDDDLARVVRRAGLSWTKVRTCLRDDGWRAVAERNRAELRALGLWGVPSFRLGDWACWGQDRLERVAERLARLPPPGTERQP